MEGTTSAAGYAIACLPCNGAAARSPVRGAGSLGAHRGCRSPLQGDVVCLPRSDAAESGSAGPTEAAGLGASLQAVEEIAQLQQEAEPGFWAPAPSVDSVPDSFLAALGVVLPQPAPAVGASVGVAVQPAAAPAPMAGQGGGSFAYAQGGATAAAWVPWQVPSRVALAAAAPSQARALLKDALLRTLAANSLKMPAKKLS